VVTDPEAYCRRLGDPALSAHIATRTGLAPERFAALLRNAIGDVTPALALIRPHLAPGARVLEIGAGLGLTSAFLHLSGVDVTPLEPGEAGFILTRDVGAAAIEWLGAGTLSWLRSPVASLSGPAHGQFDLIFSVNVLEHIADLDAAFAAMAGVLAPGGVMVHSCPNYAVPYEPHYGMPLVPFFPRAMAWLRPSLWADPVWRSLNFVTFDQARRMAASAGLELAFASGTLAEALRRLEGDAVFRSRHGGVVQWAARIAAWPPLQRAVLAIPASLATPMVMTGRHKPRDTLDAAAGR